MLIIYNLRSRNIIFITLNSYTIEEVTLRSIYKLEVFIDKIVSIRLDILDFSYLKKSIVRVYTIKLTYV